MTGSPVWFIARLAPATVALLGSAVLFSVTDGLRAFTTEAARRLNVATEAVAVADVELTDSRSRQLMLRAPGVTLVEFIYTTCPTICQSAGGDFFRLQKRLKQSFPSGTVRMLSISFDVMRDNREALATYADIHGADGHIWSVAVPSVAALPSLLENFGVKVVADETGGYQHNAAIHVIDPAGRLVRIVDADDVNGAVKAVEGILQ